MFERICEDGLYDRDQCQWTDCSDYSDALSFLASLTDRFYAALDATHASLRLPKRRMWVSNAAESSSQHTRKRQLLLVNHDSHGVTPVAGAYAIADIISEDLCQSGTLPLPSLLQYSDRPFALSIQQSVIHLVKHDRCGFMTIPIHIHRHPRTILGCICALATCHIYESGFPHIEFDSIQPGNVSSLWIKSMTMTHDQKATQSPEHRTHVRLTGPPVFVPIELGVNFDDHHARFLDELKDVYGIPKLAGYRSMTFDCTVAHSKGLFGPRCLTENVFQIAEHLIGISFFASREEFFYAIRSCLETHRDVYNAHNLLHNDINLVSICLNVDEPNIENTIPDGNPDERCIRQAMLRGWEFAKHMGNPGTQLNNLERQRQYSEHFLATEILWNKGCAPRRRHDLESFLWVMLFVCMNHIGPYGQRRKPPSGAPRWLRPGRLYALDICKERSQVTNWTSTCNEFFSPYFNHPAIVSGLADLASKLSPPGSIKTRPVGNKPRSLADKPVMHDYMISVLDYIIAHLPVEEPPSEDVVRKAREAYRSGPSLRSTKFPKIYG
ncbi:hypothetical protein AZE42_11084 [Rhizopogon vesiculosus]|uniref:Fungal-type protein kinase domain-containing protein n=1 Tax=Rhizopogon vesiculosus TaxID=180088 RepID=A0A1J8Q7D2_9AGAM|nr:hypothetical protein AZE42_11084 [Rhizopogon vesiculosus]